MQVIIMAAGLGNRLEYLTAGRPKALVDVAGRLLVDWTLHFTQQNFVSGRTIIAGYCADMLQNHVRSRHPDVSIRINSDFRQGNILSVQAALPIMTDDVLLMNVDHIYPPRMLAHIHRSVRGISAICDFDRHLGPDDMKIRRSEDGMLTHISKKLESFDGGYIGMTVIPKNCLASYREAVSEVLRNKGTGCAAEDVLQVLADRQQNIHVVDASGYRWLEVDTPVERDQAESFIRSNPRWSL